MKFGVPSEVNRKNKGNGNGNDGNGRNGDSGASTTRNGGGYSVANDPGKDKDGFVRMEKVKSIGENPLSVIHSVGTVFLVIGAGLVMIVGILVLLFTNSWLAPGFMLLLGIVILAAYYVKLSIVTISSEQIALKKRFNTIVEGEVYTNGDFNAWYGIESFWIIDTELIKIDLDEVEIYTREGLDPKGKKMLYTISAVVDGTASCRIPRDFEGLRKLLIEAPDPKKIEGMFKGFVTGTVREVLKKYTWMELKEGEENFSEKVAAALRANKKNPLIVSGIQDIYVQIEHIHIPEELEKAILNQQNASFEAETLAVKTTAEVNAKKLRMQAMAENPFGAEQDTRLEFAKGPSKTVVIIPENLNTALDLSNREKRLDLEGGSISQARKPFQDLPADVRRSIAEKMAMNQKEVSPELSYLLRTLSVAVLQELAKKNIGDAIKQEISGIVNEKKGAK